jgi:hypothetical protein
LGLTLRGSQLLFVVSDASVGDINFGLGNHRGGLSCLVGFSSGLLGLQFVVIVSSGGLEVGFCCVQGLSSCGTDLKPFSADVLDINSSKETGSELVVELNGVFNFLTSCF